MEAGKSPGSEQETCKQKPSKLNPGGGWPRIFLQQAAGSFSLGCFLLELWARAAASPVNTVSGLFLGVFMGFHLESVLKDVPGDGREKCPGVMTAVGGGWSGAPPPRPHRLYQPVCDLEAAEVMWPQDPEHSSLFWVSTLFYYEHALS